MPRRTIRQHWSFIVLNGKGMRAPVISMRLGIPQRKAYGILSRHAARPRLHSRRSNCTDIPMTSSGLMLNHTLTIMHWQIEVSSCRMGLHFIYAARITQEFLANAAIDVLLWPPKSPDIYIIENIWLYISRRLNCMNLLPRNDTELRAAVGYEWQRHTGAHPMVSGQRPMPTSCYRGGSRWTCQFFYK